MFYSTRYFIRIVVILTIIAVITSNIPRGIAEIKSFINFLLDKFTALLG